MGFRRTNRRKPPKRRGCCRLCQSSSTSCNQQPSQTVVVTSTPSQTVQNQQHQSQTNAQNQQSSSANKVNLPGQQTQGQQPAQFSTEPPLRPDCTTIMDEGPGQNQHRAIVQPMFLNMIGEAVFNGVPQMLETLMPGNHSLPSQLVRQLEHLERRWAPDLEFEPHNPTVAVPTQIGAWEFLQSLNEEVPSAFNSDAFPPVIFHRMLCGLLLFQQVRLAGRQRVRRLHFATAGQGIVQACPPGIGRSKQNLEQCIERKEWFLPLQGADIDPMLAEDGDLYGIALYLKDGSVFKVTRSSFHNEWSLLIWYVHFAKSIIKCRKDPSIMQQLNAIQHLATIGAKDGTAQQSLQKRYIYTQNPIFTNPKYGKSKMQARLARTRKIITPANIQVWSNRLTRFRHLIRPIQARMETGEQTRTDQECECRRNEATIGESGNVEEKKVDEEDQTNATQKLALQQATSITQLGQAPNVEPPAPTISVEEPPKPQEPHDPNATDLAEFVNQSPPFQYIRQLLHVRQLPQLHDAHPELFNANTRCFGPDVIQHVNRRIKEWNRLMFYRSGRVALMNNEILSGTNALMLESGPAGQLFRSQSAMSLFNAQTSVSRLMSALNIDGIANRLMSSSDGHLVSRLRFNPPKMSTPSSTQPPLIIVAGCTGTGKSDLGVALSEKFGGEVISADSMQIYQGLDIVTNKITPEEAKNVPHHLMSFVEPIQEYNVHAFQQDTLRLIDDIRSRQKLPIIVGGTAYYIESVMYRDALIELNNLPEEMEAIRLKLRSTPPEELYKQLQELDPEGARLVHQNNEFRVMRALEICLLSGGKKSELNAAQSLLRFPNTLLFILDADLEVLDERLDKRVNKMKERGVVEELDEYYSEHKNYFGTHGVRQSIGIKEFQTFLDIPTDEREAPEAQLILQKCFDNLKLHTRQYSRSQRKWFTSRFIKRGKLREVPQSLTLNTSRDFFTSVVPFALERADEFLSTGAFNPDISSPCIIPNRHVHIEDADYITKANTVFRCDTCSMDIQSEKNYLEHLRGRKHLRQLKMMDGAKRQKLDSEDAKSDGSDEKSSDVDKRDDGGRGGKSDDDGQEGKDEKK